MIPNRIVVPLLTMAMVLAESGIDISDAYGVVAPSTFSSTIQVQGEAAGTEFNDWAGIPIAFTDNGGVADNPGGFIDINTIQIANDDDNLYIYVDLVTPDIVAMATMNLAFDLDNNLATGHNLFTLGAIGSELGYQTDYPFVQDAANYNTGVDGVVEFGGDFIGLGFTYPFFDENGPPSGNGMEWTIPRNLAIGPTAPGTPVFTGNTFTFIAYTELGNGDLPNAGGTFEQITYTFASNPNPGTPGDFDGDDDVDGRDFLAWQRGESPNSLSAGDLADWQNNFGAGPLAAVSAIPEPSCVLLLGSILATCGLRRRNL